MQSTATRRISLQRASAYVLVAAITFIWILPILWMLVSSFRDPSEPFYSGILPSHFTWVNFHKVLSNRTALTSFRNSFVMAFSAAMLDLVIASLAAYGFSRFRFTGKNAVQVLLMVVRLFPGVLLAITLFQVAGFLKVYDTVVPLILANSLLNLPFAIWNLRTMYEALPIEIEEAAWIDGANRLRGIGSILLPLMAPGLAATGAFAFLLSWNEYLFALSFIRTAEKQMITTTLASNIGQYNIDYTGLVATAMLASIPLMAVFLYIQRYIVSGLAVGAVRG